MKNNLENNTVSLRFIEYGSNEYQAAFNLRRDILRKPLGLDFTPEQLKLDEIDLHLAAFDESKNLIIGALCLHHNSQEELRVRQVAISPNLQGNGIGTKLMNLSEDYAKLKNYNQIILHARSSAISFYEKLGYKKFGDEFTEIGLSHFKMQKHC